MSAQIARAGVADVAAVAPLFDAYRQFYQQPADAEAAERYVRDRLAADEAAVWLARDDAGTPIGFALCYATFSSVVMKRLVILNDLYVVPERRGEQVSVRLIEHCVDYARALGAGVLRLRTAHDNAAAQRVYERFGFVQDLVFRTYDLKL